MNNEEIAGLVRQLQESVESMGVAVEAVDKGLFNLARANAGAYVRTLEDELKRRERMRG